MTEPHPNPRCPKQAPTDCDLSPPCELMRAVYILCHMMMRVIDRVSQPEGLTGSRWHLLAVASDVPEPLTITQLSEHLFISPQNVSRMVAALESEGLVARDTTGPGRTVRVVVTDQGRSRFEACAALAERFGHRMMLGVPPDEVRRAVDVLERVIAGTASLENELDQTHNRTDSPAETEE